MFMLKLDPPIPVETPKGKGYAIFIRDYSLEYDDMWTVVLDSNGEFWTFNNKDVRAQKNYTLGRKSISSFF